MFVKCSDLHWCLLIACYNHHHHHQASRFKVDHHHQPPPPGTVLTSVRNAPTRRRPSCSRLQQCQCQRFKCLGWCAPESPQRNFRPGADPWASRRQRPHRLHGAVRLRQQRDWGHLRLPLPHHRLWAQGPWLRRAPELISPPLLQDPCREPGRGCSDTRQDAHRSVPRTSRLLRTRRRVSQSVVVVCKVW